MAGPAGITGNRFNVSDALALPRQSAHTGGLARTSSRDPQPTQRVPPTRAVPNSVNIMPRAMFETLVIHPASVSFARRYATTLVLLAFVASLISLTDGGIPWAFQ